MRRHSWTVIWTAGMNSAGNDRKGRRELNGTVRVLLRGEIAMRVIDMHCDTILQCFKEKKSLLDFSGHINVQKLRTGGCLAQCFALFIPTYDSAKDFFGERTEPWELYHKLLQCYQENLKNCSEWILPARSAKEIQENCAAGRISSILTIEDGVELDGCLDRIDSVWADGVRMIALTWNYENCIGFPNSADHEAHIRKGLKPFGFEAIGKMNDLGILVDVSHLSEAGFYDVARCSRKPFVASHSCCRALRDHPRNLTDDQLRTIGETGSIVGINFYDVFLGGKPGYTAVDDIIRHMVYAKNKAGMESVALGSDMDGIESTLEFGDYSGFPQLLAAMEEHFTSDEIEKICSKNFLRVFSAQ